MKQKQCKTCRETKPVTEFNSTGYNVSRITGERTKNYKPECKICHQKRQRDRYNGLFVQLGVEWKCIRCGYNRCVAALELHHRDESTKEFTIASRQSVSLETLRKELEKCDILCANCHREHHAGLW